MTKSAYRTVYWVGVRGRSSGNLHLPLGREHCSTKTKPLKKGVHEKLSRAEENSIILLHDYYDSSVEAALKIVDALLERGFEFVTVDELVLE